MKRFARLIQDLELSNKTLDKIEALVSYFEEADDADKLIVIALFTGKKPKRPVSTTQLRDWAIELSQIPAWLFAESYHSVGDLSETIALLVPHGETVEDKPLAQWLTELSNIRKASDEEKKQFIINSWRQLGTSELFIFNKLISGNFRIGVSHKMLVNALARYSGREANVIMHAIMGSWSVDSISFTDLLSGAHINSDSSWPYPFCLAYALDKEPAQLGSPDEWQAEWKWDGIRGQLVKRNGELHIWSRGEELVTAQFPELMELQNVLPDGTVLDGEILSYKDGKILPFSSLQQRLNRKTISRKQLEETPVAYFSYDLLEFGYQDIRSVPLKERRQQLESLLKNTLRPDLLRLSPSIVFSTWEELAVIRQDARVQQSEGIMLKSLSSTFHSGRKHGDWWKWKLDPYTVDAVLIYAQKGSGRRANFYTDYTFAVWSDEKLVTIAKAYSGLTDSEIREVNAFVNKNAIEKFGPVRTVKPELVFEIAFEGISESKRHKAGLALRFPRIARWRKDKIAAEANTLDDLRQLIKSVG